MVIVFLLFSFLSSSPSNRVDHHFNDFLNNFSFIFQIVCPLFLPITWSCASLSNQGSFFFCFRLALLVISNSFTLYLIPNGDVSLGSSWPPISGCLIVSTEEEMSILFVDFVFRINPPPPPQKKGVVRERDGHGVAGERQRSEFDHQQRQSGQRVQRFRQPTARPPGPSKRRSNNPSSLLFSNRSPRPLSSTKDDNVFQWRS